MRRLEIVQYDIGWPDKYKVESEKLKEIFGEELVNINHIGSTSIPEMVAKPIIDMLIEVQDINKIDYFNHRMIEHGYLPRGENGIKGRRYFIKESKVKRTFHIHIYQAGAKELSEHLAFRDFLIENKVEREKYKALKQSLLQEYGEDVKGYQERKAPLVKVLTEKALKWANE
ncbi:GrpB family protein [Alkalihalobacterium bogoriense]|uniref:GrpB family protein n=1 Tax=Alkalihalobacterium bogoriense TaxID=246272 RepID=UPI0004796851|nr:GrpB family protein [Alkalihalobacterium bogoriense]